MAIKFKRTAAFLGSSSLTSPLLLLGTASALLGSNPALAMDGSALPQGGTVTGGSATIATSGQTLTVNQTSSRAVIDWRSFNIGADAQANFNQPNSGSIAVNRVNGSTDPSQIDGSLHANGQVWILNPNGVLFGTTAHVDAAGIVATTANIDTKAFMAGSNNLQMTGGDSGQVVNQGSITVGQSGLAAFVAPSVRNSGTIRATVGKVALAAGDTYTLDLAGDHLVEIGLGATKAVVDQSGKIVNPGGTIAITAKAASQVVDSVINMSGVTDASSVKTAGGQIILGADDINVASTATTSADGTSGGQITAIANKTGNYAGSYSAQGLTGDGGQVETSGKNVTVAPGVKITAASAHGSAGTWTIDPLDVTITSGADNGAVTGGTVTTGTIEDSLAGGTGVTITTDQTGSGNGDLTLASSINVTSTSNAGLTLTGRHLSATGGSTISITGGALTLNVDAVNSSPTPSGSWINDALKMIGSVDGGSTVNLGAGTYTVASGGSNYVSIGLSNVTIDGSGEASTIIDARNASTYGLRVVGGADNVTLENFTLWGVTASGGYGLKAEATQGLTLDNIASRGAGKSEFDLNGVVNGTLNNLMADGAPVSDATDSTTTAGNGISLTDSQGITISNSTTKNDAWGGLALYQGTTYGSLQLTDITVDGSNTFNEANGIYAQDQSSVSIGTINLNGQGIQYIVQLTTPVTSGDGTYTLFQKTQQGAIDQAAELNGNYSVTGATVRGYAGTSLNGNNVFTVGYATGGTQALSINAAISGAAAGATVDVLPGTYDEALDITKSVDLEGAGIGQTIINITAGNTGLTIGANNVTIEGFTFDGPLTQAYTNIQWNTANDPGNSWGIQVTSAATSGFSITDDSFENIRTGILLANSGNPATGAASGSITSDVFDNTKGGVIDQYRDGSTLTISGNSQGSTGNEWGVVYNTNLNPATIAATPDATRQSFLLSVANANSDLTVLDRGYTSANRTAVTVDANASGTPDNGYGNPRQPLSTIQAGIADVVSGGTVNVDNGTYVIASGGGNYINVNKSLNLIGQSETGVIIDARNASTYGLRVTATDGPVDLENFTLYGVTASGGYGLKAEATDGLTLAHVTSEGAYKSEFDLNGVVNGTLNYLTANGDSVGTTTPTAGNGISLTDSQNITITNSVTENNLWGGLALYQGTTYGSMQLTGITVDGTNTFNEANGIYAQDQSSVAIGAINLAGQGIQYVVQLTTPVTSGDGTYTLFQQTQQGAIDQGAGLNAKYTVTGATVQGYAGTSLNGNNVFTVGHATDGDALSVNAALNQSSAGGVINVLSGTYAENVAIQAPRTVNFGGVTLSSLTSGTGAAGSVLSGNVAAGSVALNGATVLGGNLTLDTSVSNGNVTLAAVDGSTVGGQALTILTGSGVLSLGNVGATTTLGSLTAGNVTLTGSTYDAGTIGLGAATLTGNAALTGNSVTLASVDGTAAGSQSLTVAANTDSLGNVGATTALRSLTVGNVTLTGSTYDAGTIGLGAVTLSGNATLTGNSVTLASVDGTTAGSQSLTVAANTNSLGNVGATTALGSLTAGNVTLTGSAYDAGTIGLGAVTLSDNATLTGNSVTLASVDGITAGSQSLTVTGNTAALGNLGATTRLGAVDVAANATLSGANDAASFTFGGSVTLTAASTVLDTTLSSAAAGDITFAGAIFGTGDSGQSLTLSAGPGTGAASANGDITMANAGTTTVRLGALNVSGNNFTALTVDLAGDFTSRLTGNQVFAADTLNAGGNVNTQANGNVSGHIISAGTVALTTPGIVSGNIGGSSLVLNSGSVSNATLTGGSVNANVTNGFNATVNATNSANIAANTISGNIGASALVLNSGSVSNATLTGNSVNANVTNGFNATVNATNSANIAANTISGNIGASALVLNSGSVSNATLTGNSVNANVTNGFNATVNATNSANIAASTISGSISGATLTISGGLVSNATFSGTTVNANVTGGFDATVNASNSASIAANTISGNFSGATVSLNGQSVSGQVTATTLNVASQGGTVTGDFTPGNVTGFVDLNGQTTSGGPHVPGQQLVVENFALPTGTQIAANGALILPQGLVIGLLSPGGGPAKVIMVHDVQTLGQLLAEGYVAIVIDLKNDKDAPVTVASN